MAEEKAAGARPSLRVSSQADGAESRKPQRGIMSAPSVIMAASRVHHRHKVAARLQHHMNNDAVHFGHGLGGCWMVFLVAYAHVQTIFTCDEEERGRREHAKNTPTVSASTATAQLHHRRFSWWGRRALWDGLLQHSATPHVDFR